MSHPDEGTLHAYLDGELEESERRQAERHLEACARCRARLEAARVDARRAAELLAELEPRDLEPPSWRELEGRAAARAERRQRRSWRRPALAWAASLVLAFGLGWLSGSWRQQPLPRRSVAMGEPRVEPAVAEADREAKAAAGEGAVAPTVERSLGGARRSDDEASSRLEPSRAPARDEEDARPQQPSQPFAAVGKEHEPVPSLAEAAGPQPERPPFAEAYEQRQPAPPPEEPARLQPPPEPLAAPERDEPSAAPAPPAAGFAVRESRAPEMPASADVGVEAIDPGVGATAPGTPASPRPDRPLADGPLRLARARAAAAGAEAELSEDLARAAARLGGALRALPELRLLRVETLSGGELPGTLAGQEAVRLVYADAAGHELALVQQRLESRPATELEGLPSLIVEPDGGRSYRWFDEAGYLLLLQGEVSGDSLRALAERVR